MNIKKIGLLLFLLLLTMGCVSSSKEKDMKQEKSKMEKTSKVQSGVTKFEKLNGYFVKNTVIFDKSYKFIAVSNQKDFDQYFGMGKTMKNEITPLDFEKFNVAGILVKPIEKQNKLKLTTYTSKGAKQIVGFNFEVGDSQSFASGDLLLFKIPKSKTSVEFISRHASETIEIK